MPRARSRTALAPSLTHTNLRSLLPPPTNTLSLPQRYHAPLAPGQEASLEYKFRADPSLGSTPPRDLGLSLHLLYAAAGAGAATGADASYFTRTLANATRVGVSEAPRLVDFDLVWLALTLLALAAAAAYFGLQRAAAAGLVSKGGVLAGVLGVGAGGKGAGGKGAGAAAPAPLDEDEWVKGTHYDAQRRRKQQQQQQQQKQQQKRA